MGLDSPGLVTVREIFDGLRCKMSVTLQIRDYINHMETLTLTSEAGLLLSLSAERVTIST